jgi:hypothetical protein
MLHISRTRLCIQPTFVDRPMLEASVPVGGPRNTLNILKRYQEELDQHFIPQLAAIVVSYTEPNRSVIHCCNLIREYTSKRIFLRTRYGMEIVTEINAVPAENPNNIAKCLANGELILEIYDIANYCGVLFWSGLYISWQWMLNDQMTSVPVDGISHVKFMETLYDVQRVMYKGLAIIHHSDGKLTSHICPSQYSRHVSEMCYPPDALVPKGMTPLDVLYNDGAGIALLPNGHVVTFGIAHSGGAPYDDSKHQELGEVVTVHTSSQSFLVEHAKGYHYHGYEPMSERDCKHLQTGIETAWDTSHSWLALCTDGHHIGFGTGHCAVIPAEIQRILDRAEYKSIIGVNETFIVLLQDGTLLQWGGNESYYCAEDDKVAEDAKVVDTSSVTKYERIELRIDGLGKRYCLAYKLRNDNDEDNSENEYDVFT